MEIDHHFIKEKIEEEIIQWHTHQHAFKKQISPPRINFEDFVIDQEKKLAFTEFLLKIKQSYKL